MSPDNMTLAEAALWYAAAGVPVFPIKPRHKFPPLTERGHNDATTNPDTIRAWWAKWPNANIGAAAGVLFDVIDEDGQEGADSLNRLFPQGRPPVLATVDTPRPGGRHHYIPVMGAPVKAKLVAGVDTRGIGGYAVLPPSHTIAKPDEGQCAGTYRWTNGPPTFGALDLATVTACKPWRKVWETKPAPSITAGGNSTGTTWTTGAGTSHYGLKALEDECVLVASTQEGARNDTLNRAAFRVGQLIPHEVTAQDALGALTDAARACGLPDGEIAATINSGLTKGQQHPRYREPLGPALTLGPAAPTGATQSGTTSSVQETQEGLQDPAQGVLEAPSTSWRRVDLAGTVADLLAGTLQRPAPTVGAIRGGSALFYRGRINGIAGESGSGKTWTALHAARQELDQGGAVVYVDHEDDAGGITGRLLDLGATPDAILERFAYFNPDQKPTAVDMAALVAVVADLEPALVVIDSTGEGLSLSGANPNADDEVAAWFLLVPRRLAKVDYGGQPGPAVVVLDHVTKTDEGGLWPIGSQRKRAAITGAQYMQRVTRPFAQDSAGAANLICAKDRHGNYRMNQRVAVLTVTPGATGPAITLEAATARPDAKPWRPTAIMEKVSQFLESQPKPQSFNAISLAVRGKTEHKSAAINALEAGGYVAISDGPRKSHLHRIVKPYRQAEDPESDAYQARGNSETGGEQSALTLCPTATVTVPRLKDGETENSQTLFPGNSRETVGKQCPSGEKGRPEVCRLHPGEPLPGCWTCDQIRGGTDQ